MRRPVRFVLFVSLALGCDAVDPPAPIPTPPPAASTPAAETNSAQASASRGLWTPVSEDLLHDGWIALFDGKTLFGWQAFPEYSPVPPEAAGWSVKDGAFVAAKDAAPKLVPSVSWQGGFGDCDLRFEATPGNGDAGFGIFMPSSVGQGLSSTPGLSSATGGEWHPWEVSIRENTAERKVTIGAATFGGTDKFGPAGDDAAKLRRVGFGLVASGPAKFRGVILKPFGLEPLFNGVDLAGWNVVPGSKAEFTVEDSAIRARGGAGFLETNETYGDFVLQFEARANAPDSNSGLFFRAEEGTEKTPSNGYELQLQNTIADGDRTQPADYGTGFGTGAIFRRQKARYVNSTDGEWCAVTLVAVGNRMATWVNGLQVTDFTDDRKPHANPREGRRDEAGRISLQGHDPTTDTSFRNLRIKRLAP